MKYFNIIKMGIYLYKEISTLWQTRKERKRENKNKALLNKINNQRKRK